MKSPEIITRLGNKAGAIVFSATQGAVCAGEARLKTKRAGQLATLQQVVVHKRYRKKGIGGMLLRAVCRWLDQHDLGCKLYVLAYDAPGRMGEEELRKWYGKHGWKPWRGDMKRPSKTERRKAFLK